MQRSVGLALCNEPWLHSFIHRLPYVPCCKVENMHCMRSSELKTGNTTFWPKCTRSPTWSAHSDLATAHEGGVIPAGADGRASCHIIAAPGLGVGHAAPHLHLVHARSQAGDVEGAHFGSAAAARLAHILINLAGQVSEDIVVAAANLPLLHSVPARRHTVCAGLACIRTTNHRRSELGRRRVAAQQCRDAQQW